MLCSQLSNVFFFHAENLWLSVFVSFFPLNMAAAQTRSSLMSIVLPHGQQPDTCVRMLDGWRQYGPQPL